MKFSTGIGTDIDERAVAACLQRSHPSWAVWWGPWSRVYWGIFAGTGETLLATTWEALDRAMRVATDEYGGAAR